MSRASCEAPQHACHDAGTSDDRALNKHANQQVTRFRSNRQTDAKLARSCARREREHARHAHNRNGQRHTGRSTEDQRVDAIRGEHFGAHVLKGRRALHWLICRQLPDGTGVIDGTSEYGSVAVWTNMRPPLIS